MGQSSILFSNNNNNHNNNILVINKNKRLIERRNAITPGCESLKIVREYLLEKQSSSSPPSNPAGGIKNLVLRKMFTPTTLLFVTIIIPFLLCIQPAYSLQCVQCSTDLDEFCKCNPPAPKECPIKEYDHCVTVKEKNRGKIAVFTRSCSPEDLGNNVCIKGRTPEGEPKEICYTSCTSDGCNKEDLLIDCEPGVTLSEEAKKKLQTIKDKVKTGAADTKHKIDEGVHKIGEKIDEKLDKAGKAISAAAIPRSFFAGHIFYTVSTIFLCNIIHRIL